MSFLGEKWLSGGGGGEREFFSVNLNGTWFFSE